MSSTPGARFYLLVGAGALLTAAASIFSGVPMVDVIVFTLLPLAQLAIIERVCLRYKEHLGSLRGGVNDLACSLVLIASCVGQFVAGMTVPPALSAVITVPLFLVALWTCLRLSRHHFEQAAARRLPGPLGLGFLFIVVSGIVIMPIGLLAVVLTAWFGGDTWTG